MPLSTSLRLGQHIGVWMKKFVAIVPSSTISWRTFGSGVCPLLNGAMGKLPPSI